MAFEVGDEVVYDGSLGTHHGTVVAVSQDGAVEVSVPGLPERLRTDTDSLSTHVEAGAEYIKDTYGDASVSASGPVTYDQGGVITSNVSPVVNTTGEAEPVVREPAAGNDVTTPPASA